MPAPKKTLTATIRLTTYTAICNSCKWQTSTSHYPYNEAIRHATLHHHNITLTTTVHATLLSPTPKT